MKKFRFSLRSVQTVRGIREMHAKEAFSSAMQALSQTEAILERVRSDISNLEQLMIKGRGASVRPAEQVSSIHEHEFLRQREKLASAEVDKARQRVNEARERWIIARRDMKIIDNLEVKARQEYRQEFEREEQALMDDRTNALAGRAPLLTS